MPFQVVCDDSGCKGQGPHLVMGGLIGRAEQWAAFADKWAACLAEAPTVAYFKMSEAAGCSGQFYGLNEQQRNDKLVALVKVLNEFPFDAIHVTLDLAEHATFFAPKLGPEPLPKHKISRERLRVLAVANNSYFYAFNTFLSSAAFHLWDAGERERFEFIVDEHRSLGERTHKWYPVVREAMFEPIRSIMPTKPLPRDDLEFLPLQAADMIAWLQRAKNTDEGHEFEWLGPHFTNMGLSPRSAYLGPNWFATALPAGIQRGREREPNVRAFIELARLEGAPIPPDN